MSDPHPSRRGKRTDSAAMWDDNEDRGSKTRDRPRDRDRGSDRHTERRRSRSRDKKRDSDRDREQRDRRRSRSRDKRDRNGDRGYRGRDDDRDRERRRSRSPPHGPRAQQAASRRDTDTMEVDKRAKNKTKKEDVMEVDSRKPKTKAKKDVAMDVDDDDEEAAMRRVMGFSGFRTTKQTKVPGNDWYGVRKEKKAEYRQYMNRVGGFNRPLSPSR